MTLPAALPRVPIGITQGAPVVRDGIAVSKIFGPGGLELPIEYRYKPGQRHDYEFRGYAFAGSTAVYKTWGELAAAWPAFREGCHA